MKRRFLFQQIIELINHKNAIVLTGLRQVGKTTLMRQVYDIIKAPKLWFDLDNPLDQKYFEDIDYKNIFHRLLKEAGTKDERLFVFIVEIQNLPEITKIVKYLIDHYNVKFFLTGSSNFYLRNLFPESLSGRKFLYRLDPLSFREYLYFTGVDNKPELNIQLPDILCKQIALVEYKKRDLHYHNYSEYGGFPEVVLTSNSNTRQLILKNIFASFFEKDLRLLSDYRDIRELRDLILLLVPRCGNLLDVSKLASELGIDRVKTYNYLEFLQGIFFIRLLPKYSKSIDRSVAGGRKVYFCDSGMLNFLGKITEGQLLENTIINQLSAYGEISFYHYRNTAELDAVYEGKIAFEIKKTGTSSDIKKAKKIAEKLIIPECFVISQNFVEHPGFIYPQFL